jgi:hypothetical protein
MSESKRTKGGTEKFTTEKMMDKDYKVKKEKLIDKEHTPIQEH